MNKTFNWLEELEIAYDSSASASLLVLKAGCEGQLLKYQLQMIASNKICHIITPEIKQNDGIIYFCYNITSRLSLAVFLKRRKLARHEFIRILGDIAVTAANSQGYLLSDTGFILDAEYMYINPVTLDIQLVYVPLKREGDMARCFQEFISSLVLKHAEMEEGDNDNFLQRILNFTKSELFNLPDFCLLLNRLNTPESSVFNNESTNEDEKCREIEECRCSVANEPNVAGYAAANAAGSNFTGGEGCIAENSYKQSGDGKKGKSLNTDESGKRESAARMSIPLLMLAIALQAVIATAFILAGRYLGMAGNNSTTNFAALLLIALAIDVLLFRRLISMGLISTRVLKSNAKSRTRCNADSKMANPEAGNISGIPASGPFTSCSKEPVPDSDSCPDYPEAAYSDAADAVNGARECSNTVMLSRVKREYPCLLNRFSAEMEEIIISKPEFVIGRLKGQVDHAVSNSAVGKVHACIITRACSCFIIDYNSVNGTYINDARVDSNKEYELKDNDIVAFANSRYVFLKP